MSEAEVRRIVTQRWISRAREDLEAARVSIQHGRLLHVACFHAQQAAEKAIKAAYVWLDVEFGRTHDLDELRNRLPGHWLFKTEYPELSSLTFWAVEGRYPGDWPEATEEQAREALAISENVVGRLLQELAQQGFREHGKDSS